MRITFGSGVIASLTAVIASGAAVVLTSAAAPRLAPIDTTPHRVSTTQAQLSCPQAETAGAITSVQAVAPPSDRNRSSPGQLLVQTMSASSSGRPLDGTRRVGTPVSSLLDADAPASVTIEASGGLAPGAYAAQRTVVAAKRDAGLSIATCQPTADIWWFTGIDTSVGATSRLVLSNPTPAVAVADLTFYGPQGIVSAVGAKGIAVAPASHRSIDLARFAPGLDAVTLHVRATRGRLAAAVDTARLNGVTPAGDEWIAASVAPATTVLVNAGDSGDGDQRLVVTNTSGREALIGVDVLDASGPFTPPALAHLRIPPGHTVVEDVSSITGTSASALQVTVDGGRGRITAALVSESARPPLEFSTSSSSPALSDPAVVPVFDRTRLSLSFASTVDGGGAVRIQAYDDTGRRIKRATRVAVKARTAQTWTGPVRAGTAYLVVTVAGGSAGAVQAVATYSARSGQASIPIASGIWTVTRPAVRPAG